MKKLRAFTPKVTLTKPRNNYWWTGWLGAWICDDGLKRRYRIPARVREIRLEVFKRPATGTVEVIPFGQYSARLADWPKTYLMGVFSEWLRDGYAEGYRHFRITYEDPK